MDPNTEPQDAAGYVDQDGNFKSLGHLLSYTNEISITDLPEGAPDPTAYSPEQEQKWREDFSAWKQKQATREAVAEALKEQQPQPQAAGLTPYFDDPHAGERAAIRQRIADYQRKADSARILGEGRSGYTERDYRQRIASEQRDLDRLPPEPARQYAEAQEDEVVKGSVDLLFDQKHFNDPIWEEPRMQEDAAVELTRFNKRTKELVRLPLEDAPYGNPQPCRPSSMIEFDLGKDQLASFKSAVYGSGGDADPVATFRRAWNWIRSNGIAHAGRMATHAKGKKAVEKKTEVKRKHPDDMSQREYEAWRGKSNRPGRM